MDSNILYNCDCLEVLGSRIKKNSIDLIYLDPPFFSNKIQNGTLKIDQKIVNVSFNDSANFWKDLNTFNNIPVIFEYFLKSQNRPEFTSYLYYMYLRLKKCYEILKLTGSLYLHCDEKASHYLKILLDEIFGVDNFKNEIIWCYKGGNATKKFRKKHDTILFYTKSNKYTFNVDDTRIQYSEALLSGALIDSEGKKYYQTGQNKSGKVYFHPKGQLLYDWWVDILSSTTSHGKEIVGYPTQKPLKLLKRIILASSNEGDIILDPFCGSGTTLVAAKELKRNYIGIDINELAIKAAKLRLV